MCCIFTCCGWMIDLIQRLWTFAMSCCISSAVCCVLVMSSMSGIAMGYNYSLAEYIDLKETNVSVYLKRGVFDDDIADDIDWRRSGHMPISGHIRDQDLVTALPDEQEMPLRSGRRLDDSVHHSDDHNNFEGSLMRLTARPPAEISTKSAFTRDEKYNEIVEKYPTGSLEQLKELHSLFNMRKAMVRANTVNFDKTTSPTPQEDFGLRMENRRMFDGPPTAVVDFRRKEDLPRKLGQEILSKMNPARFAVPDPSNLEAENWYLPNPNVPLEYKKSTLDKDPDEFFMFSTIVTYPQPIRLKTEYSRPTRSEPYMTPTQTMLIDKFRPRVYANMQNSDEANQYKTKIVMDDRRPEIKFNALPPAKQVEQDYEEEANKGVRKKRHKRNTKSLPPQTNSLRSKDTNKTNKHVKEYLGKGLLSRIKTISSYVHNPKNKSEDSTFAAIITEKSSDNINNADSEIIHQENNKPSNIFEMSNDNGSANAISVTSSILMSKTNTTYGILSSTKKSSFLKFLLP